MVFSKSNKSKELKMDKKIIDAIERHYEHAKEKHPRFLNALHHPKSVVPMSAYTNGLRVRRKLLNAAIEEKRLCPWHLLDCELSEMYAELAKGDKKRAVEECYDAIAVLLRIIDVIEERQKISRRCKVD